MHIFGSETNIEGTDWRLRGWRAPPDSRSFHSWKYSWPTIQQIHSSIHGNNHHLPGNKYIISFKKRIFVFFVKPSFPQELLKHYNSKLWGVHRWHLLMIYTIQTEYFQKLAYWVRLVVMSRCVQKTSALREPVKYSVFALILSYKVETFTRVRDRRQPLTLPPPHFRNIMLPFVSSTFLLKKPCV